ncbi:type II toxin-antitoxin system RelE/ParE family toxin [Solimonas flava]|uniref:type II toxin-antitoxin system RelE/ParE family toxin n=1 Tax=Solimonas flava TaxID=415849 RepID=UPI0006861685|nr:type II toxin-antitoxin system RelE/ParE family toxin [Solimonas flava]
MTVKPVIVLPGAEHDIEEGIRWYASEGGFALADRWVQAMRKAMRQIGENPRLGSSRYAVSLNLPGLRFRKLEKFPYLLFYVEHETRIEIWRILHAQRDIPAWMTPSDQSEEY